MYRILAIIVFVLPLAACVTPTKLGISEAQWQGYAPEERQRIKSGYYEILKDKFASDQKSAPDGTSVSVRLAGGQTSMPPFAEKYRYAPIELNVFNGECQNTVLKEQNGDKTVKLQVCYIGKTLFVDPSRYDPAKRLGSIQLHYSPIWDRGFTYRNVSSTGYAQLKDVNVTVRRFDDHGAVDRED